MAFTANQVGRLPSYGYIWMNTGNWTGVAVTYTGSYQELTGFSTAFTLDPTVQDFEMTTDGRLKYIGIPNKRFLIDATAYTGSAAFIKLYKTGAALNDSESYSTTYSRIPNFLVDLSTNDYVSLWAKGTAGSNTILQITLSATSTDRR